MIDRVVQRPFLLWQAEAVADSGADPDAKVELPAEAADVTPDELEEVRRELAQAVARERAEPMTPVPDAPEADERRGEKPPPIEERSYLPRDAVLSLAQAAIERYLREHRQDLLVPLTDDGDDRRGAEEVVSAGPDATLRLPDDAIPDDEEDDRRLGGAFEITDPGWVSSLVAMGWRLFRHRRPFNDKPAPAARLAENARVVVVGDWASGTKRARDVAAQIAVKVTEAAQAGRECHVVHLGDTYYAGWDFEYEQRFLPWWPVRPGEPHGSWSLNGNHDMYAGGHGYFDVLLADERFRAQGGSSWFSLENDHWQLLGLDTAYTDHALTGGQAQWIADKVAGHPERKTMLLSHHQLFSAFGHGGPKLERALHDVLASDRIDAWLWGHEHRCIVYEAQQHVRFPRCIGHGGVPVYAEHGSREGVRWYLEKSFQQGLEEWALHGFAVLDFDGPRVTVDYFDEFGGSDLVGADTIE
jgi:hypothetical protein